MKPAKRILLTGIALLMSLSLSGCMILSCQDCCPSRPRRVRRPVVYRVASPPQNALF